jgi:hypothetical protein
MVTAKFKIGDAVRVRLYRRNPDEERWVDGYIVRSVEHEDYVVERNGMASCIGSLRVRAAVTPGYNRRLSVAFTVDKHGKPIAYRWSGDFAPGTLHVRWIRMPLVEAQNLAAQGAVERVRYVRWGDPPPALDAN